MAIGGAGTAVAALRDRAERERASLVEGRGNGHTAQIGHFAFVTFQSET